MSNNKKITLSCDTCRHKNYRISKSIVERLQIRKFCPNCKMHKLHKEEK